MNEHVKTPEAPKEMPQTIGAAINQVMGQVRRLKKADENKHGHYNFTSVDDFKDALRPLLVDAGLYVHVDQTAFAMIDYVGAKNEKKSCAQFDFSITLKHVNGGQEDPEKMTVALPFTGAQTSGAARSYAIKEWQKSRFLMSSGDDQDEADLLEQSREGLRLAKAEARDLHKTLVEEMRAKTEERNKDELAAWWQENKYRIETLPKDWFIQFRLDYATAYKELRAQEELDRMTGDELDALAQRQEQ